MDHNVYRIESLLSARIYQAPQVAGDKIYFVSNLSGRNSLYRMRLGGSVPEPLLPPHFALQNPHLMAGRLFVVFPALEKILVMLDRDGDENYRPMLIPVSGGYPLPLFADTFADHNVSAAGPDLEQNIVYFIADARNEAMIRSYRADMASGEILFLNESTYGGFPAGRNKTHDHFILLESYGAGDNVLFRQQLPLEQAAQPLYGTPRGERTAGEPVSPSGFGDIEFAADEAGLIVQTVLFDDRYSLAYLPLAAPEEIEPIAVRGLVHEGDGELNGLEHLTDNRYLLTYNIDSASWLYEATFDRDNLTMQVVHVLVGQGRLAGGVLESIQYDLAGNRYALSFSTATSPTQLYTIEGERRERLVRHTDEKLLGIPEPILSSGEDYPFTSHDGLRVSARLYLPAAELGYEGPRPLVYYIHGGPQSQERPDFAWFSMPLIQFLTLQGFAVFVPNVRGSTGYGFSYMKHVVRDWGGQDRLDHVFAMSDVLPKDNRLDTGRAGVVGRSYGGYMTLTLAGRHPELWAAAVDMFGPYDLLTFADRVPETWKPFIAQLVGDPATEREFMIERSPRTYIDGLQAPLLVIQGKNDPRVREIESRELVEHLREQGKEVDYLMLSDEGHDVLKFDNRVRVYNAIADFFEQHLCPGEPKQV